MKNEHKPELYYYSEEGAVHGPFGLEELVSKIKPDTLIFKEDGIKWDKAEDIPELKGLLFPPETTPEPTPETLQPVNNVAPENKIEPNIISDSSLESSQNKPVSAENHYSVDTSFLESSQKQKSSNTFAKVALGLLFFSGIILGYIFWLAPYLKDKNAPRKYCFIESLVVRSSKVSGVEYNVLGSCSYGEELIVYEDDGEWSTCKYNNQECFVASKFLLNKKDFHLMHSIFKDNETRGAVPTSKCRKALFDYFRIRNYIGVIDESIKSELFEDAINKEVWQLSARNKDYRTNTVYFTRIVNPNSKFTDFACIITDVNTGRRKFLLFTFSDIETPSLEFEQDAPSTGYINYVSKTYDNYGDPYYINYTTN